MESQQKTKLPSKFVQLINTIIQAQTQTDTWKSKLFYVPVDDVYRILKENDVNDNVDDNVNEIGNDNDNEIDNSCQQQQQPSSARTTNKEQQPQQPQTITLSQILTFIQTTSQCDLTQQQQKVIQKYFNFSEKLSSTKDEFVKKLKPINNKLILSIERQQQIRTKQLLNKLFKSILQGYEKIHPLRNQCSLLFAQIKKYFQTQQLHKSSSCRMLAKQALKQFMFEADIYNRVNFAYVKDYVFGDREEIGWGVLLGMKDIGQVEDDDDGLVELKLQGQENGNNSRLKQQLYQQKQWPQKQSNRKKFQKIEQLEEENIVTEKLINVKENGNGDVIHGQQQQQLRQQQQQRQQQQWHHQQQQHQQQQQQLESTSMKEQQQQHSNDKINKKHKQIAQIQQLLNRTKQRYQKNKQQLQNQAKNIKDQQQKQFLSLNHTKLNQSNSNGPLSNNNGSLKSYTGRFAYTSRVNQIYQQIKYDKSKLLLLEQNGNHLQQQAIDKQQLKKQLKQQLKKQQQLKQQKGDQSLQQQEHQHSNNNNIFSHKISQNYLLQQQLLQESAVKPLFTRQAMRKEINDTLNIQSNSSYQDNIRYQQQSATLTREDRNKFYQQTQRQQEMTFTTSNQSTQRREVGKIKRRSMSKDIAVNNINSNNFTSYSSQLNTPINSLTKTFAFPKQQQKQKYKKSNNYTYKNNNNKSNNNNSITNYGQYEAVLKQIKKQQTQYKSILQAKQKGITDKQARKKRLTLDNVGSKYNTSPQSSGIYKRYTPINSLIQVRKSQKPPKQFILQHSQQQRVSASMQKPTISHSRYEEIMKEIETNSLARSRVSSKKRQEIVQKATSQARLRIQQIQNRALKRLAKADSTQRYSVSKKSNNYLNLDSTVQVDKQYEMPKYRKTKQNPTNTVSAITKSQKSSSPKNYFINDMLNERPTGLKLTSNYRQKY